MKDVIAAVALLAAVSLTIEKVVSFVRNSIGRNAAGADKYPTYVYNVLALVVGVGAVLGWPALNFAPAIVALVPALAPQAHTLSGTSGEVLSGLLAGAGAGFAYGLLQALEATVHRNDASAGLIGPDNEPEVGPRH